jgi:hypothetical protein
MLPLSSALNMESVFYSEKSALAQETSCYHSTDHILKRFPRGAWDLERMLQIVEILLIIN